MQADPLRSAIERLENALAEARSEELKARSAYHNAYKKFDRRRSKREAIEDELQSRRQGQLPLFESVSATC